MSQKGQKEVDSRTRIGDFEIDLIIGKNHKGAQLTIVDRIYIDTYSNIKESRSVKSFYCFLKALNIVKTIEKSSLCINVELSNLVQMFSFVTHTLHMKKDW